MFFQKPKKHISDQTDEELILQYKQHENAIYIGELFKRYTDMSFLVCMKYLKHEQESRDAVMQVFEKLMKDLKKYEVRSFKYWLHRVLKNHCLVILEKRQREIKRTDEKKRNKSISDIFKKV